MTEQASHIDDVGEFYDDIGDLVEIVGGNVHQGYWLDDEDRTPFLEALNRLTELVTGKLDIRPGQHLLDVGCGVGMPAIRVAQKTDAQVTAITVSKWQIQEATRRVNGAGLRGQVRFERVDAGSMPFPDDVFDAVLAFDSFPNSPDKAEWLREMVRVLRPAGRCVVTELTRDVPLTAEDIGLLKAGAILQIPPTIGGFVELVSVAGLVVDEYLDLGDQTRRTYTEFFEQIHRRRSALTSVYGAERIRMFEQGMAPLFELCRQKIGYVLVTAHKPAS